MHLHMHTHGIYTLLLAPARRRGALLCRRHQQRAVRSRSQDTPPAVHLRVRDSVRLETPDGHPAARDVGISVRGSGGIGEGEGEDNARQDAVVRDIPSRVRGTCTLTILYFLPDIVISVSTRGWLRGLILLQSHLQVEIAWRHSSRAGSTSCQLTNQRRSVL